MRFFTDLWRCFIKLGRIFVVLFMIWKLHMRHILLNLLMLFGKEFAEIYFPWLIMLLYKSMFSAKKILIILLHHRMMTIKEPLHMIFFYNTDAFMHDLGIRNIFTKSLTKRFPFNLFKWRRRPIEYFFIIYVPCPLFTPILTILTYFWSLWSFFVLMIYWTSLWHHLWSLMFIEPHYGQI